MPPRPPSRDAAALLQVHPDALVVAGSYRAMIDLKMRRISPRLLVDLRKIPDSTASAPKGGGLRIGAMTTLRTIMTTATDSSRYAALPKPPKPAATPRCATWKRIGGSLTYDAGSSDVAAALLALTASLHVVSARGERTILAHDAVISGALSRDEIITAISLPAQATRSAYEKFKHPATFAPVCGVAVSLEMDAKSSVEGVALVVVGAADRPARLKRAEEALYGQPLTEDSIAEATSVAGESLAYVSDLHFSGEYRAHLTKVLLKRALTRLI